MPRALTEQEKCVQCQRFLEKGQEAVLAYGFRKVSVEDIAKAAGMAKGTFYQHFESKEDYLFALVGKVHSDTFALVEQIIVSRISAGEDLQEIARFILKDLITMPGLIFFIQNEHDITMLLEGASNMEQQSFRQMENELFSGLLHLIGVDTEVVKPGVVHNYVHTLFLLMSSDLMSAEDLPETLALVTESLISYVFGKKS